MSGLEIEDVVFLKNTEIFEERKHMAFLLLLRPIKSHHRREIRALARICEFH